AASASSGLSAFTFATTDSSSVCSVTPTGLLTILGGGQCKITVSQAGNANYDPASAGPLSFAIGTASQTISFTPPPSGPMLAHAPAQLAASASSGLSAFTFAATDSSSVCSVTLTGLLTILGGGQCKITVSQAGNANYDPAFAGPLSFAIGKA